MRTCPSSVLITLSLIIDGSFFIGLSSEPLIHVVCRSTCPVSNETREMYYRLRRRGPNFISASFLSLLRLVVLTISLFFLIFFALSAMLDVVLPISRAVHSSTDSQKWTQLRLFRLLESDVQPLDVGLYACSPNASSPGMEVEFFQWQIDEVTSHEKGWEPNYHD